MTAIRNINRSQSRILADKVRRNQVAAPLRRSSLTQPGDRFRVGPEGQGGAMNADGTLDWAGIVNFIGQFFQTGPSVFDGDVDITNNLDVSAETTLAGLTQLLNDLVVHGAGRIQVGSAMTLDPSVSSGAIVFGNGAQVFTDASTIQVYFGNGVVSVSNGEVKMQLGGTTVVIDSTGLHMYGLPVLTGTGLPAGVLINNGGRIRQTA